MSYGLRVKNSNLEIQIDETYTNYVFNGQSGSLTTQLSTVNLTTPSKFPPIALLRPTDSTTKGCGVFDYVYSSPNYTGIRLFGGQTGLGLDTCSFDYKIYTLTEGVSADTYGMRIRSSEGRLIYDGGKFPFKMLETGTTTIDSTYTHGDHTSPYYIFSPWLSSIAGYGHPPVQGPVIRSICGLSKQSTTSVKGLWIAIAQIGITNTDFVNSQGSTFNLIICDPG